MNYRSIPRLLLTTVHDKIFTADFSPRNYDNRFYFVTHKQMMMMMIISSIVFQSFLLRSEIVELPFSSCNDKGLSLSSSSRNRVSNCFTTLLPLETGRRQL